MPTNHEVTTRRRVAFLAFAVLMNMASIARGQDSVELRSSARVDAKSPVLLRHIADLKGDVAKAVGDVVVLESLPLSEGATAETWPTVDIAAVRRALEAKGGVNWGRLALRGSSCILRRPVEQVTNVDASVQSAPITTSSTQGNLPTVRSLVAPRLAQIFRVDESKVRVTFDESSKELLDAVVVGRTVELTPMGLGDKVPMSVRVYQGDRVTASGSIRVGVQLHRTVMLVRAGMKKGDTIDAGDVVSEERWVTPTSDLAETGSLVGGVTRNKLSAGQMVLASDVEAAVVVKRGELVSVSCVSDTVVVKAIARATQDARVGEVIKLEHTDSKKRTFQARVSGPGRAVAVAAGSDVQPAVEPPVSHTEVPTIVGVGDKP